MAASPTSAGKTLPGGGAGPLGDEDAVPPAAAAPHRPQRLRRRGHRRRGRLRLLRRRHAQGRDRQAGGGLRPGRDAGRLQQLRPPRHARRADDDPRGEPGARRRHRGAAAPAGHAARLHRGQAQLLAPELRAGAPPAHGLRAPSAWRCAPTRPSPGRGRPSRAGRRWSTTSSPSSRARRRRARRSRSRSGARYADGRIVPAAAPVITAQCIRVPASRRPPGRGVRAASRGSPRARRCSRPGRGFAGKPQALKLPSRAEPLPHATSRTTRGRRPGSTATPATAWRSPSAGCAPTPLFDYRFVCLSHNTVRGAAGGAVLTAELLTAEGYIQAR